jgi:uncharacterized protein
MRALTTPLSLGVSNPCPFFLRPFTPPMCSQTPRRSFALASAAVASLLFLAGCQTHTQQAADFAQSWRTANLATAADEVGKKVAKHLDDGDTIIWRLEQGGVLRTEALANLPAPAPAPGQAVASTMGTEPVKPRDILLTEQSNEAFAAAQAKIVRYEDDAKLKLGSETGAVLTNQANLPYRGRAYDKIMLHTYVAANYLKLGELDKARVELNRLLQSQRDAIDANAKRIAKAQEEAAEAKEGKDGKPGYDAEAAQQDPKVTASVSEMETELNANTKGYENYVNPFAVFLDGLFFGANAEGPSDMERARKSFQRVAAMSPDNPYAQADLAVANELHLGKSFDKTTYVVFETGSAPIREQWRIDLPIFAVTGRLSYVGAALPRLKFDNNYTPSMVAAAGGATYPTSLVSSMDSVIAQDFKNEWPVILTRTILSVAVKATADAVIQNQVKDQGWQAQLLAKAVTLAYGAATNIADTRAWISLPKQFQYCRFPTPEDGKVSIQVGGTTQDLQLVPGQVNLIWVKNVAPGLPSYVSQAVLKP